MQPRHYRDALDRAIRDSDSAALDRFARLLSQAAKAKELLCFKGHGAPAQPIDMIARRVPVISPTTRSSSCVP